MEKIYQVFVSSTFSDLQDERKEVMQALLELDCLPAGMELFPASNDDQWTLIKKVIDSCDYYLLIVGGRYGSIHEETKISYTQMEYEYAVHQNKPVVAFLPKNPDTIPAGKTDQEDYKREKLEAFKQIVQKKLVRYWSSPEDLGSCVSRSMIKLFHDFPAEGWVKRSSVIDENSLQQIAKLQHENEELRKQLNTVSTEAPKGTELLSQGDETYKVRYSFVGQFSKNVFDGTATYDHDVNLSWNDLLRVIAPNMIQECAESKIRHYIEEHLDFHRYWHNDSEIPHLYKTSHFSISNESFHAIIIQFRALGLITLSDKKHLASDTETYWKLTPYGDYIMTQLLAIQRTTSNTL